MLFNKLSMQSEVIGVDILAFQLEWQLEFKSGAFSYLSRRAVR
jgi:hypothetical protein